MSATTKTAAKKRYYNIKIRCMDIRVLARNYREARTKANNGRGRVVGIYFN